MITVTEAMDLKIELLKACGLTKEMLKKYYPERIETEDTLDESILKELLEAVIDVEGETYKEIISKLICTSKLCPFCAKYKDCEKCLYKLKFGYCDADNGTLNKFYDYMKPFYNIKPLQKTKEEKEEIYKKYIDKVRKEKLDAKLGEVVEYKDKYLAAIEEIVEGGCDYCYFECIYCNHVECTNKIYVEVEL